MKVENLINDRGNSAANQIIIYDNGAVYFQSYKTTIAEFKDGILTLKDGWCSYSRTTNKHLYMFIRNHTKFNMFSKDDVLNHLKECSNIVRIGRVKQYNVFNLENDRYNSARNQFVIDDIENRCIYFQSYDSMIAKYDCRTFNIYLTDMWDYSATTRKHLYIFLREYCGLGYCVKKDVLKHIENDDIRLSNDI